MSLPLRFLPEARDEFDAAAVWYDQQRPGLGIAFIGRVREVLKRISANPKIHAKVYREARKAVVKQFPYVVIYQEEADEVLIIAVFHCSRNPATWMSRV